MLSSGHLVVYVKYIVYAKIAALNKIRKKKIPAHEKKLRKMFLF